MKIKSYLVLVFTMLSVLIMNAQQLPNSSFETFETGFNGAGVQPTGWKGANVSKTVVGITVKKQMVSEEANGYIGKCVKIHNEEVGAAGINETAPSWITLGTPWNYLNGINTSSATAGTDGGMAFTYRPDSLVVWVKRTYNQQEDANIVVYLWQGTSVGTSYKNKGGGCSSTTHTDEESDIRQQTDRNACTTTQYATQVGEGSWRSNQQITNWTRLAIPINYYNNLVPEKINVIYSSGNYPNFRDNNGVNIASTLYVDEMYLAYSSQLSEIRLNNRPMSGFDKDTYTYTYSLGQGVTTIPTITAFRNGREISGSELSINYGTVGQPTTITVTAEDGSSTTTYTINFVGELSSNPRPAGITVNGTSIASFNPYVYNYNVELPYGTTTCPTIAVQTAESGQTSVINCTQVPGSATVTVTAENGTTTQVYTINFTIGALTDNTLENILLDGVQIPDFSPTKTNYIVDLPVGTTTSPTIQAVSAYATGDQTIVIDDQGLNGTSTITVTPTGTTNSRIYRISYRITASTNTQLLDIQVGGTSIEGFNASVYNYTYSLPIGTAQLPTITWTPGDAYQTVVLETGGTEGVTKITVTSQSGAVAIYRITFSTAKSSNSYLTDITLDGVTITGFDASVTSYQVILPIGTTVMPTVAWSAGDIYQNISFTSGGINGTSRIVVRAQDNSVTTYTIAMSVAQADNATLLDLKVAGSTITGFRPDSTYYTYLLPRGTTELPEIIYTPYDAFQTIRRTDGGIDGETRITVRAQSGASTIYVIAFSVMRSSDATLSDILVGGVSLDNFNAQTEQYDITLPSGTAVLPTIEVVKNDEAQRVSIVRGGVNGITTITVIAEDGTEKIYSLQFSVVKSENALLSGILVGGDTLEGFDANIFEYFYTLPAGTENCPTIQAIASSGQYVTISSPRLEGTAKIEVTPEEGAKNVYVIHFAFAKSTLSFLNNILIDEIGIVGFTPDSFNYVVTLPIATTTAPTITAVAGNALQQIYLYEGGLNRATQIDVVAENGAVSQYSVTFEVAKSNISTLQTISINGVTLEGYQENVYSYNYILPMGTTTAPVVTYIKGAIGQSVEVITPACEGNVILNVTAEDGSATSTYHIAMTFAPFTNSKLAGITRDGVVLENFEAEVMHYVIDLEANQAIPAISYIPADSTQMIAIAQAGIEGTEIVVVAQNGNTNKYTVHFNRLLGTQAELSDIKMLINNRWVALPEFSSEVTAYNYTLPWRTTSVPVMDVVNTQAGQQIKIIYGSVNGTTTVEVTSEDGNTVKVYTIAFEVEKSNVSSLNTILIADVPLPTFNASTLEYTVQLPYQTQMVPKISWECALDENSVPMPEQQVILVQNCLLDTSYIKVMAEDGSETIYKINFEVAKSSAANELSMILLNGLPVDGFVSSNLIYNVSLLSGTTEMPTITYVKNYPEQSVMMNVGTLTTASTLTVYGDDKSVAPTVYTLNMSVASVGVVKLESILVDGAALENFNPEVTSYVIPVAATPVITYQYPEGTQVSEVISNSKQVRLNVFSMTNDEEMNYDIFFYYTLDIIPNGDFSSWETAVYNSANRPTGWMVPADAAEKYRFTGFGSGFISEANKTYTTGQEVQLQEYEGNSYVKLFTRSQEFSIHGGVPGMITLGNIQLNLSSSGGSSSSVSGGIAFRNTPDEAHMDYFQEPSRTRIDNMRFVYQITDGLVNEEVVFTDNTFAGEWKHMTFPLSTTISAPSQMNLIVNAGHTEDASGLGACAVCTDWNHTGTMFIDNVAFYYNNRLSNILVDGVALEGFVSTTNNYSITLPSEYAGIPQVTVEGEVEDQAHRLSWSGWNNGVATTTIEVMAEDLSKNYYTVTFNRPVSTIATLSGIEVDGLLLEGFQPNQYSYDVEMPFRYLQYPSVTTYAGSQYQTTAVVTSDSLIQIVVTAEDGTVNRYHINLKSVASTASILWDLEVVGGEFVYNPDQLTYQVDMIAGAVRPEVLFTKMSDGQQVIMDCNDMTRLVVTSEDGLHTTEYTIAFNYPAVVTTGKLALIALNETILEGYSPESYNYNYTVTNNDALVSIFTKEFDSDVVTQYITNDSVVWNVQGSELNSYVLNYLRPLSADNTLASVSVNNEMLLDFNSSTYLYQVEVERNEAIRVEAIGAIVAQELLVQYAPVDSIIGFDYQAISPNKADSTITRVEFNTRKNSNAYLADILINGESLVVENATYISDAAFDSTLLNYSILLKVTTPKQALPQVPTISAVAGSYGQTISIENNGLNEDAIINVIAEDGTEVNYILHLAAQQSDYALLSAIVINNQPLATFNANTFIYEVVRTDNDNVDITYRTDDAYQSIVITQQGDTTIITVTAEDGKVRNSYYVILDYQLSSETTIESILLDGQQLENFQPDSFYYEVELPVGTTQLPNISVVGANDNQNIAISTNGVNGNTLITVTAQDGTEGQYTISFTVKLSQIATLDMIYLNYEEMTLSAANFTVDQSFNAELFAYQVTLPVGTRQYPTITWDNADIYQSVQLKEVSVGNYEVVVTAQDTMFRNSYAISFVILKSTNAQLANILINDEDLDTDAITFTVDQDFAASTYRYQLQWPIGTTQLPRVAFAAGDTMQNVVVTMPTSLNDSIIIAVTAEDNAYTNRYVIHCSLLLSENSKLNDLTLNGSTILGFHPDSLQYHVLLPIGTTEMPSVQWQAGDAYQTISAVNGGINGDYSITVKAQDTTFVTTYVIHFTVELSHNAYASMIYGNGNAIQGFDMELFDYTLVLPYAQTQVPVITCLLPEPTLQNVAITQAATVADTAYVVVTAQDGVNVNTYRITFRNMLSDNALLEGIYLDGEMIDVNSIHYAADNSFDSETYNYSIILPYGTTELPTITWKGQVDDYYSIELQLGALPGTSIIKVVSQDMNHESEYSLSFQVRKSNNALLEDLLVQGVSLNGFNPTLFEYTMEFPIGTDTASLPRADEVTYLVGHYGQMVEVNQVDPVTIVVIVTAEDGETFNVYVINMEILLSNNALLKDIIVDGSSIRNFAPSQFEYTYLLFPGAQVPEIEPIKGEESQQVFLSKAAVGELTYIYVEAEDGTESTYTIHFTASGDNPGDRPKSEDVCWSYLGNGSFKASTRRNNVSVLIFEPSGRLIERRSLPLVDPNVNICESSADGEIFTYEKRGQVYLYVFIYDKGKVIDSGKFLY